jgi:hypothetical protein
MPIHSVKRAADLSCRNGQAGCRASSPIASNTASVYIEHMTSPWVDNDEWLDWYKLTPAERWRESQKLWEFFLSVGGSLDPEPDSESPFDSFYAQRALPPDGRAGVRIVRRGVSDLALLL